MKNNNTTQELYILTGGPGAGKTTLLNALKSSGFTTVDEEGRRIIKEQLEANGEGLPWVNKELFARLMFNAAVKAYKNIAQTLLNTPVFFDRGIIDTIGYLKLEKIPVPKEMEMRAYEMEYNRNVFILPPWKEIYENDNERKQSLEVAKSTFECMVETYKEYGYHLIEVPKISVDQRVNFILNTLDKS